MYIIPSLYIRDNKTVALADGATLFDANPAEMAKKLASAGAEMIYIVDLGTPPAGNIPHLPIIEKISSETNLKIQITGNIRSEDVVERYMNAGAQRIILGNVGYQKPDFLKKICDKFPGKIGMPIDVRAGKVVIKGWTVAANKTALDYAEQFTESGVGTVIYSDVNEEGRVSSTDITRISNFLSKSPMPVMHSSDVSSVDELEMILALDSIKFIGTIIGKSMYSGIIDIASTITHVKERTPSGMDEPTLIP